MQSGPSCPSVRRAEERVVISLATNNEGWMKAAAGKARVVSCRPERRLRPSCDPIPCAARAAAAWNATPGWARPPAEFKHINKRRRRNLRGFP